MCCESTQSLRTGREYTSYGRPAFFHTLLHLSQAVVNLWSYKGAVLGACTLAFFATMVARLSISPVVPSISAEFSVSNGAIGLALSGMWLAYAISQFPSGLLGDRFGERRVILVAVGGTAVASGFLALSPTYGAFLFGAVLLGSVAGLHYSVATSLLTRIWSHATGSAIGMHTMGAPMAGLLAPVAAGMIGAWIGWRYAVALGLITAVPIALFFAYTVRPITPSRPEEPIKERLKIRPLVALLSRPPIAITVGLAVSGAFVWQATASFLPAFLVEYHGYSEVVAGTVFSGYFIVQGLAQPGLGTLSDRIGRYPTAAAATFVGVLGYMLLVIGSGLWMIGIATVLAGIAMSWGAALLPKFMDHLDADERGAGFGLVRTTYMTLGASGSVVAGTAADIVGWGATFVGLAILLTGMTVVLGLSITRSQGVAEPARIK